LFGSVEFFAILLQQVALVSKFRMGGENIPTSRRIRVDERLGSFDDGLVLFRNLPILLGLLFHSGRSQLGQPLIRRIVTSHRHERWSQEYRGEN
jgi:hypothetical protein